MRSQRMSPILLVAAGLIGVATPAVTGDEKKVKEELQKLEGNWKVVKFEAPGGKEPPKDFVAKARLVFQDGKLLTMVGDAKEDETTFKIDPTQSPKWIDVVSTKGPNKGKAAEGIYDLDGDNLKICMGPPGQKRPAEFKVSQTADALTGVMILKRQKP